MSCCLIIVLCVWKSLWFFTHRTQLIRYVSVFFFHSLPSVWCIPHFSLEEQIERSIFRWMRWWWWESVLRRLLYRFRFTYVFHFAREFPGTNYFYALRTSNARNPDVSTTPSLSCSLWVCLFVCVQKCIIPNFNYGFNQANERPNLLVENFAFNDFIAANKISIGLLLSSYPRLRWLFFPFCEVGGPTFFCFNLCIIYRRFFLYSILFCFDSVWLLFLICRCWCSNETNRTNQSFN